jgi:bla regulator protein BlaR1
MITYIVKTLLCAAILFLIYFLFLEREKMYRFNRFYLLFSIVFSFGISFITIKTASSVVSVNELIAPAYLPGFVARAGGFDRLNNQEKATTKTDFKQTATVVPVKEKSPLPNILLGLYLAGTAYFLIRFVINLSRLLLKVKDNKSVAYHGAKLILSNDIPIPYSFLKYIFIDNEKYEQGSIEKEILQHELTHVNQKHTLDILMVELITVFAWINPLMFLYRKAIMLNHEYLADEAVVNTFNDSETYRQLLFSKVCQSNNLVLSSSFNYLTTKRRFIMMTRKTSQKVAILKQIALIPMIAVIGFLFSTRVIAQDQPKQEHERIMFMIGPPYAIKDDRGKPDAPQSVVDEYHSIVSAYKIDTLAIENYHFSRNPTLEEHKEFGKLTHLDTFKLKKPDRERLKNLFSQMSHKQQLQQSLQFSAIPALKTKMVPTKAQMKLWQDPKKYGVWINGKRYKNTVLSTRPNTDFSYYELIKYDDEKAKFMKYQIEVGLMTPENFVRDQKYTSDRLNAYPRDKYDLVFRITTLPKESSMKITNK